VKRAVGYVRVSHVGGREGDSFHSPELQRQQVEAGASRFGYEVTHVYEELDVSGRAGVKRPQFEAMLADARAGKFDAVIVAKLSRFGRSVEAGLRAFRELDDLGVAVVALDMDVDTSTAAGRFVRTMWLGFAEMESDRIADEWRAVNARRKAAGIPRVNSTARPYGYRVDGSTILGVDNAEADGVRLAFELRAKGASYSEIQSRLRAEGHRPPKGGDKFPRATLSGWLRNPLYAGLVEHDGELIESDKFGAIITRELFDTVQATHKRAAANNRYRSRLLSGVLRCSGCGSTLTVERYGSRGKMIPYYACRARDHSRDCPCKVSITAAAVDDYVERLLQLSRFKTTDERGARNTRRVEALEAERDRLREGLDRLADDRYRLGAITPDEYERQARRLGDDVERVEAQIAELRAEEVAAPDFLDGDGRIVGWDEQTLRERQRIVGALIEGITVYQAARRGRGGIDFGQRLRIRLRTAGMRAATPEEVAEFDAFPAPEFEPLAPVTRLLTGEEVLVSGDSSAELAAAVA
jgi:DNA invertase Pin-like site-specific DNA recombinase